MAVCAWISDGPVRFAGGADEARRSRCRARLMIDDPHLPICVATAPSFVFMWDSHHALSCPLIHPLNPHRLPFGQIGFMTIDSLPLPIPAAHLNPLWATQAERFSIKLLGPPSIHWMECHMTEKRPGGQPFRSSGFFLFGLQSTFIMTRRTESLAQAGRNRE